MLPYYDKKSYVFFTMLILLKSISDNQMFKWIIVLRIHFWYSFFIKYFYNQMITWNII